ncbi:MAG TPA: phosphoenolpyruvate carboxykinase (ATP) [Anaerolineales bacterium]|nr:phosphoenolpyruvate carboxykinase (ATP) [Anaerolineales bacterium]
MKDILGIRSPAQTEAGALRSDYGLEPLGLSNLGTQYWNLPPEALYEEIVFRREGTVVHAGPLVVTTGDHTARAANDKFIVREPSSEEHIWWGDYNRPFPNDRFQSVLSRLQGYLQGEDIFIQDCFAGADPEYRMPVRIITELAWHSLFARNMFLLPESPDAYRRHVPEFTVLAIPGFRASSPIDDTRSGTFILVDFARRLCLIGNTAYAGEIKKSVFTVLNYLLPLQGVMPMHCSANVGPQGEVALFFGLSGTGKTTLSADPKRRLIGDDEHGWSDAGVFNFEGGCYAKVIRLSPTAEPEIYACTRRFGTILENVAFDSVNRRVDLDDDRITENTRASYPLDYIANAVPEKRAGHPSNIVLLTCDASGVMPPLARLSPSQALYQFISGYTSKIAGTEVGVGVEPQPTFSTCFGAPFMVHHPSRYADLLRRKVERYGVHCWLVNTGWIGGPYGVGKRISIGYTRALLNAALDGTLHDVPYARDPVFGFDVPQSCDGVPAEILNPAGTWPSQAGYMDKYRQLAARFIENFKKFEDSCPEDVIAAGPRIA